jgi:hypothetical protein
MKNLILQIDGFVRFLLCDIYEPNAKFWYLKFFGFFGILVFFFENHTLRFSLWMITRKQRRKNHAKIWIPWTFTRLTFTPKNECSALDMHIDFFLWNLIRENYNYFTANYWTIVLSFDWKACEKKLPSYFLQWIYKVKNTF